MTDCKVYSTNQGVTLIEVMVAFVILALSVTVLLRIFSGGLSNTIISQQYVDAVTVAESQLAQLGLIDELQTGVETGQHGDIYRWRTQIEPYMPWQGNSDEILLVSAFLVNVEVSWRERGKERRVNLSSIKLRHNNLTGSRG